MPAPTVTVRPCGSKETISSRGFKERKVSLLSAMLLKQWRVPRTFSFDCFLTKSWTCSRDLAAYRRSVPYSRLPAQFVSFSVPAQAKMRRTEGLAIVAEESLIKVRLFMAKPEFPFRFLKRRHSTPASLVRETWKRFSAEPHHCDPGLVQFGSSGWRAQSTPQRVGNGLGRTQKKRRMYRTIQTGSFIFLNMVNSSGSKVALPGKSRLA